MTLHPKIQELKSRAAPINFRSVSVSESGKLIDSASNLDKRVVEGYAIIWGNKNLHGEIYVRGCCAKSISERGPGSNSNYQIKFFNQHDEKDPLGTLEILKEDETGLYFRTNPLDEIPTADRLLKQVRSGTINNFSHGSDYVFEKMEYDEARQAIIMKEIELFEISPVSLPSDLGTFVIRSKENAEDLYDETESFITQLPRKLRIEARHIFARYKSLESKEPFEQRNKTLETLEPVVTGIDYDYLLNNF